MVHFKTGHRAACLTSPAISPEDYLTEFFVRFWIQSQRRVFLWGLLHDAFAAK